ncbi:MAG TPA: nucleoside hydrolase [Propionibacteriaceae bacterium]|nr:nucleoside hydrolase [Propionibacteriaceae bacterium]
MPNATPRTIILDCDPGHDDAIALLVAYGSPNLELAAVTTVAGNQILDKVTRNAQAVATVGGLRGVPVAAGAGRPLVREPRVAEAEHGASGLDGVTLPAATVPVDPRHAVELIIETVMSRPTGEVTLVPTAALTNLALAVRLEPRIVDRVREVVLMGGAYAGGNLTAAAEFNIAVDPEAAQIVFGERWPVTMVGLDVTHQALATPDVVQRIAAIGTRPARFVTGLLDFFTAAYRTSQGFSAPPVHDVCAVAYVADPAVLTTVRAPVAVELSGGLTTGMTVADRRRPAPEDCSTRIATALDPERLWDLVVDALTRLGDPVPQP